MASSDSRKVSQWYCDSDYLSVTAYEATIRAVHFPLRDETQAASDISNGDHESVDALDREISRYPVFETWRYGMVFSTMTVRFWESEGYWDITGTFPNVVAIPKCILDSHSLDGGSATCVNIFQAPKQLRKRQPSVYIYYFVLPYTSHCAP